MGGVACGGGGSGGRGRGRSSVVAVIWGDFVAVLWIAWEKQ